MSSAMLKRNALDEYTRFCEDEVNTEERRKAATEYLRDHPDPSSSEMHTGKTRSIVAKHLGNTMDQDAQMLKQMFSSTTESENSVILPEGTPPSPPVLCHATLVAVVTWMPSGGTFQGIENSFTEYLKDIRNIREAFKNALQEAINAGYVELIHPEQGSVLYRITDSGIKEYYYKLGKDYNKGFPGNEAWGRALEKETDISSVEA